MMLTEKIKTRQKRISEELTRAKRAEKWAARMARLATRKNNPKSETQFCEDHGLHQARFNRHKNGKITPDQESFEKVEAAFKSEGV